MDSEDREHFKTIAEASAGQLSDSKPKSGLATSPSRLDPDSCLTKARAICGCYRRDEAQDPETFAAALALILGDYPASVVNYAADPRTGVVKNYPMGLPQVGQIAEFCDAILARQERIEHYSTLKPVPRVEPPVRPGEITYGEFLARCAKGELKPRPFGRFEIT